MLKFVTYIFVLLFLPLNETGNPVNAVIQSSSCITTQDIRSNEKRYLEMAETISDNPPVTITSNRVTGKGGDKNSYVSLACYLWPNPDTENGMPYVRIDGEINPETRSEKSDLPNLINMAQRVELLSNSYQISGDEKFAKQAIEQLHDWFINPETSMDPHLKYAQRIKGRNSGRSYGVIDTWWLIRVVDSFQLLDSSNHWSKETEQELMNWFTHYLNWLRNSEFGQKESRSNNNHGTWYDLQVVTFARFLDQHHFVKDHLEEVTRRRISRQITIFGRQKYEARRPRPLHYSIYNLSGLISLAIHGKELNIDLLNNDRWFSGSLEDALLYLIKNMDGVDPASLIDEFDQTDTYKLYLNLLCDGWNLFQKSEIKSEFDRLSSQN